MKNFLVRGTNGQIQLQQALTLEEQVDLFTELVERIEALEAQAQTHNGELVKTTLEFTAIRRRLDALEKTQAQISEALLDASASIEEHTASIASLERIRDQLITDVYPLQPDNGYSESVNASNIVGIVGQIIGVTQRDRLNSDGRLLRLESKVFAQEYYDQLNARITDINTRLASEVTALTLRLDALAKNLSMPAERRSISLRSSREPGP